MNVPWMYMNVHHPDFLIKTSLKAFESMVSLWHQIVADWDA